MAYQYICSFLLLIAATGTLGAGEIMGGIENDIIDGVPTTIEEHPYLVGVQLGKSKQVCGGALIKNNTVLTTSSCLVFYSAKDLTISVNNGDEVVEVDRIIDHPDYGFFTTENDVAVLKLTKPVSAATINLASAEPETGAVGVVTGWNYRNELIDITKTFITSKDCASNPKYGYDDSLVYSSMVCGLGNGCNGFSGNPYVVNNELVGLLSWGAACNNRRYPAIFSNIAALKKWVDEQ